MLICSVSLSVAAETTTFDGASSGQNVLTDHEVLLGGDAPAVSEVKSVGVNHSAVDSVKPMLPKECLLHSTESQSAGSLLHRLDTWQAKVGQYVNSTGEGIDHFFGDDSLDVVQKGSRLDVLLPMTLDSHGRLSSGLRFRAHIDLPKTNHRWKVVVTSFEDSLYGNQSVEAATTSPGTVTGAEDKSTSLGARYLLFGKMNSFSHLDFGLKFTDIINPNPFGRLRMRYKADLTDKWLSRTTQDIYWERHKGAALDSEQVVDYQWQPKRLLRSQTSAVWWEERGDYQLNQKLLWYETINAHRVHAYYMSAYGLVDNQTAILNQVSVGMNWREKVYKEWLFVELEPRAAWYEDQNFSTTQLSVMLQLEVRFYPPI